MKTKTVINSHRGAAKTDINNKIEVAGTEQHNGAHTKYKVVLNDDTFSHRETEIEFHHITEGLPPNPPAMGVTNEVLLAIVEDRLYMFQGGPCACEENAVALSHVRVALAALKERTRRRSLTGLEGKMAEDNVVVTAADRVRSEDGVLHIGSNGFPADALAKWGNWSQVEAAVKRLDPAITTGEMGVIEAAAIVAGGGAKNGLAELKSALATTSKA
mgnify:CR=1 FL=1